MGRLGNYRQDTRSSQPDLQIQCNPNQDPRKVSGYQQTTFKGLYGETKDLEQPTQY